MTLHIDILTILKASKAKKLYENLYDELKTALGSYWETSGEVVNTKSVRLLASTDDYISIERNFFSFLFLYSYYRADISKERRILYAAINQCIRGMVTGCDNILDDEYKKTLDTTLPEKGVKFRSVLDIMASDRVMFDLLCKQHETGDISFGDVRKASRITLQTLLQSGAQEATEEQGVLEYLSPEKILSDVHHYKTGVLFQSPWAVPLMLEEIDKDKAKGIMDSLYNIGMGCQLLDDMVDLKRDTCMKRNNYTASIVMQTVGKNSLVKAAAVGDPEDPKFLLNYPEALKQTTDIATNYLDTGFEGLLADEHIILKDLAMSFIKKQIGVGPLLKGNS